MAKWINAKGWLKGYVSEKNRPDINNDVLNKETETNASYLDTRLLNSKTSLK